MDQLSFDEKPANLPASQVHGGALKPLAQVRLERRATPHFKPDPVPAEYLEAILRLTMQAPSGYNFQPWRFVVVREEENRKRLQQAAFNQPKVAEAPVMVVAFAISDEWRTKIDSIFQEGVRRGMGSAEMAGKVKQNALQFLQTLSPALWLNRHTMIAVTTMMLLAESYGLDTAPMEGFDPAAVRKVLGLPENAEVVAMLAIGFAREPDKLYTGRLALSETVFAERYGQRWNVTKS